MTNEAIALVGGSVDLDHRQLVLRIVSSLVMALVMTFVTERIIEPRLGPYRWRARSRRTSDQGTADVAPRNRADLTYALFGFLIVAGLSCC